MAKVGDSFPIFVTCVEEHGSQCMVYAQVDFPAYSEIESLMLAVDSDGDVVIGIEDLNTLHVGDVCLAKYKVDDTWYRAQVSKIYPDSSLKVCFMDFGNEEKLMKGDIAKAPARYFTIPPLAVTFVLAGITPSDGNKWTTEELTFLKDNTINTELTAVVTQARMGGRHPTVKLKQEDGQSIAEKCIAAGKGKAFPVTNYPCLASVTLKPETKHQVYVTYSESPLNFWIQPTSADELIEAMHAEIEEQIDSIPTEFDISPGMLCLAKYAETETFFRAVISKVDNVVQTVTVVYIDYGNSDTVDITDLKVPLPKQFSLLPAQAVPCCLKGEAVGKSNFNTIVESENIFATVLTGTDSGHLVVDLEESGTSVKSSMPAVDIRTLENALPKNVPQVDVKMTRKSPPTTESIARFKSLQFDLGKNHDSCISNVDEETGAFHCQLMTHASVLDDLMQKLQQSELVPVRRVLGKGEPCLVRSPTDNLVYRAAVEEALGNSGIAARMVDFGFIEVVHSKNVFEIKSDLTETPTQCFQCNLDKADQVPIPRLVSMLENYNSKVPIVLKVLYKTGHTYLVELFDTVKSDKPISKYMTEIYANRQNAGAKPTPAVAKSKTVVSEPTKVPDAETNISVNEQIYVTAVLSDTEFFGQLSKYSSEELEAFQAKLLEVYTKSGAEVLSDPSIGDICCAKFSEDEMFYRARILETQGPQMVVSFLDYGNHEAKEATELFRLQPEFCHLPCQGIHCYVSSCYTGASTSVLESCLLDQEIKVCVSKRIKQGYAVTFPECPQNEKINSILTKESTGGLQPITIEIGSKEKVTVSHIDDPEHFYCQLCQCQTKLDDLMSQIASYVESLPGGQGLPNRTTLGCTLLAKYSLDNAWYRAKVSGIMASGGVEVIFVDYGNREVVKPQDLRTLKSELMELPAQSIQCALQGVSSNSVWSQTQIDQLWTATEEKSLEMHVIEHRKSDNTYIVLLTDGSDSINDKFGASSAKLPASSKAQKAPEANPTGWAKGFQQAEQRQKDKSPPVIITHSQHEDTGVQSKPNSAYKSKKVTINQFFDCFVSFIKSPSSFWIQHQASEDDLNKLMDRLNVEYSAMQGTEMAETSPSQSQACCAKYSEDGKWYRGEVLSVSATSCQVHFVDYGNDEVVSFSDLKQLKAAYFSLPVQALECCLTEIGPVAAEWTPESISKFEEMTMEKQLVGCMVEKHHSGKYVIELVDNTVLIHEALVKANLAQSIIPPVAQYEARRHSGASTSSSSSKTSGSRPVPGEMTFREQQLAIGKHVDVNMSYVDSPNQFWCQLTEDSTRLHHLMNRITEVYTRLPLNELNVTSPERGQVCCSLYAEDNKWYRAKVLTSKPGQIKVKFVDYGNEEWVGQEKIKLLKKAFIELPVQALECSLDGVESAAGSWTEPSIGLFEDLTYNKNLVAKVISQNPEGLYTVELIDVDDGKKKIKDKLVSSGLVSGWGASAPGRGRVEKTPPKIPIDESRKEKTPPRRQRSSEPEVDVKFNPLQLTTGKTYNMLASWVTDPKEFYCQLENCATDMIGLVEELCNFYISIKLNDLAISSPRVGQSVVAYYSEDGNWYRGIIKGTSSTQALVQYIDYGNEEKIPLSKVKQVKPEFAELPMQAIKCCLKGVESVNQEKFSKKVLAAFERALSGIVSCTVVALKEGCYVVDLETPGGISVSEEICKLCGIKPAVEKPPPPPPEVHLAPFNPPSGEVEVFVMAVTSPASFLVQLASSEEQLGEFASRLNDEYCTLEKDNTTQLGQVKAGQYCCAKYSEDSSWYRAKVNEIQNGLANVLFIDYGNTELVPMAELKVLIENFQATPPFCIECKLAGLPPQSPRFEDFSKFQAAVSPGEKQLKARFHSGVQPFEVTLIDGETDLSTLFADSKGSPPKITAPVGSIPAATAPTEPTKVYLSHVNSPTDFYIQLVAKSEALDTLMADMESMAEASGVITEPVVGQYCGAVFSEDQAWYRAKVTEVDGASVKVLFVDYGNVEIIKTVTTPLKTLTARLLEKPQFALHCTLDGAYRTMPTEATDALLDLGMDKELLATFNTPKDPCSIQLLDGDVDISVELLNKYPEATTTTSGTAEATAISQDNIAESIPCPVRPENDAKVYISHIESFQELYVQLASTSTELDLLMADLENLKDSGSEISRPCVGQYCAAVYEEDGAYYRGRVTKVDGYKITVQFVDYGNSGELDITSSPVKILPGKRATQAAFAICCKLAGTENLPSDALDKLIEVGLDKELDIQMLTTTEPYEIKLVSDEYDLREELGRLCGETPEAGSQAIEDVKLVENAAAAEAKMKTDTSPTTIQSYPELNMVAGKYQVYVTCVESPDSIYLQLSKDTVAIEELLDKLEEIYSSLTESDKQLSSPQVGQPCCGQDEDGMWYRATVTKVDGSETSVCFVDYGNRRTVAPGGLKVLNEEFLGVPVYAFQASLYGAVKPESGWSDELVDKMLTAMTDKILFAEIVEASVPCTVQVFDKGESLNETLLDEFYQPPQQESAAETPVTDEVNTVIEESMSQVENMAEQVQTVGEVESQAEKSEAALEEDSPVSLPAAEVSQGNVEVYVSSVVTTHQLYIQLVSQEDELTEIMDKIGTVYCTEPEKHPLVASPKPGTYCCAKWADDGMWYRGKIQEVKEGQLHVLFVDYGNAEDVDAADVRVLQPDLCSQPSFAIECKLNIDENISVTGEGLDSFSELVSDKVLKATILSESEPYLIDLFEGEENLGYTLQPATGDSNAQPEADSADGHSEALSTPADQLNTVPPAEQPTTAPPGDQSDTTPAAGPSTGVQLPDLDSAPTCQGEVDSTASDKAEKMDSPDSQSSFVTAESTEDSKPSTADESPLEEAGNGIEPENIESESSESPVQVTETHNLGFGGDNEVTNMPMSDVDASMMEVGPSDKVELYVCYIVSPCKFWCQLSSGEKILDELFEKLENIYEGTPVPEDLVVQQGMIFALKFAEDEKWYRGKAVSQEEDSWLMFFIDFGNTDLVDVANIRPIKEELLRHDHQAFECDLQGVQAKPGGWSEEAINRFEELVTDKKLLAQLELIGGNGQGDVESCYIVSLLDMGIPIAGILLKEGYAVEATKTSYPTDTRPKASAAMLEPVSTMDGEMKGEAEGQTLDVSTPVRADEGSPEGDDSNPSSVDDPSVDVTDEGSPPVHDNSGAPNTTENCQATGGEELATDEQIPGVETKVIYKSCPLVVGESIDVYVSTATSPLDLWCQPATSSTDDLPLLMDKIQDHYSSLDMSQQNLSSLSVGQACVAKYSQDQVWYRAQITKVGHPDVEVCFVDYGNCESIPVSEIKQITADLTKLPKQAILCNLEGIQPPSGEDFDKASCIRFQELVTYDDSKLFSMTIQRVDKDEHNDLLSARVSLMDKDRDIAQVLVDGGYAVKTGDVESLLASQPGDTPTNTPVENGVDVPPSTPVCQESLNTGINDMIEKAKASGDDVSQEPDMGARKVRRQSSGSFYTDPDLEIGAVVKVKLSEGDSPDDFVLQLCGSGKELSDMMSSIKDHYGGLSNGEEDEALAHNMGDKCIAQFPADNNWYRAVVTGYQVDAKVYEVKFVDYGNRCVVTPDRIQSLKRDFLDLPTQAITCCLAQVQPKPGDQWSKEACKFFTEQCRGKELEALVESRPELDLYHVTLYLAGGDKTSSVNSQMITEGHAGPLADIPGEGLCPPADSVGGESGDMAQGEE